MLALVFTLLLLFYSSGLRYGSDFYYIFVDTPINTLLVYLKLTFELGTDNWVENELAAGLEYHKLSSW